jgi:dTDP-4-dehydrorhamnose reductase
MKTMLRLASERDSLSVVSDQIGTPTNAVDLAECLLNIITFDFRLSTFHHYGVFNFSNEGQCSWYDFAKEIFKVNNISINLQPIPTTAYPTPAKRPAYSVLDKSKIKQVFWVEIKDWREGLNRLILK